MLPVTDEAAVSADEPAPYLRSPNGETVLVVEDEMALRAVTERIFTRNGYHVLTAAGGADALALIARYEGPIHLLRHRRRDAQDAGKGTGRSGSASSSRISRCCSCPATPSPCSPRRDGSNSAWLSSTNRSPRRTCMAKAGRVLDGYFRKVKSAS